MIFSVQRKTRFQIQIQTENANERIIFELRKKFVNVLHPLKVSIFFSPAEAEPFSCLYSDCSTYRVKKNYQLYDLRPLVRLLMSHGRYIDDGISKDISPLGEKEDICFILEWDDHARKVFIFHTDEALIFNKPAFIEIIRDSKSEINAVFRKLFFAR